MNMNKANKINRKKDFLWNLIGSTTYGASGMLLFIFIARISGSEISGRFSIAFVTAQMLMYIGNYGVRAFQSSDINEQYYFKEYLLHRILTSIIMLVSAFIFIFIKRYDFEMGALVFIVCSYKVTDVIADVFEGDLQQKKLFYISGISLFGRTVGSSLILVITLWITKDIITASFFSTISAILLTWMLAVYPCKKRIGFQITKIRNNSIKELFVTCFPLFSGMFMLSFIINSPKYAIESTLPYEYQTYYSALYFPAQTIYLLTSFIFKPMLVPIAEKWNHNKKFVFQLINKLLYYILVITILSTILCGVIGAKIFGFLYKLDFTGYTIEMVVMMFGGGLIAVINMLFNMLTVLRRHKVIFLTYGVVFILSLFLPNIMVNYYFMSGAVYSYIILLFVLSLMLVLYFKILQFKSHKDKYSLNQ